MKNNKKRYHPFNASFVRELAHDMIVEMGPMKLTEMQYLISKDYYIHHAYLSAALCKINAGFVIDNGTVYLKRRNSHHV